MNDALCLTLTPVATLIHSKPTNHCSHPQFTHQSQHIFLSQANLTLCVNKSGFQLDSTLAVVRDKLFCYSEKSQFSPQVHLITHKNISLFFLNMWFYSISPRGCRLHKWIFLENAETGTVGPVQKWLADKLAQAFVRNWLWLVPRLSKSLRVKKSSRLS